MFDPMILVYAFLILMAIAVPLAVIYRRVKTGHRSKAPLLANIFSFFGVMAVMSLTLFSQGAAAAGTGDAASLVNTDAFATGMGYIAAALAVGLASLGGGIAVGAAASAALGALSENESIFGKSLIFVGLAEGLALYGLLIGFMILSRL